MKRRILCAAIVLLAPGSIPGTGSAQEREDYTQDIQNVQLVFHLVQADGFRDEDPEISDVVTELRKLFSFQGYRLLSTSALNVGLMLNPSRSYLRGDGSQRIVPSDFEEPLTIRAEIGSQRSTGSVRATVTLVGPTDPVPLLQASVTMRDGQRVVLGSTRRTADEPVLILVVTPRIDPQ